MMKRNSLEIHHKLCGICKNYRTTETITMTAFWLNQGRQKMLPQYAILGFFAANEFKRMLAVSHAFAIVGYVLQMRSGQS
ncbi:hypothetical protein CHS0354_021079 [Potamilus streckersoni]|uniref:Uncharacterized protein n=1 Tax=Potamilus streckersoni TaxID=2493646 RepID=A0AAE0SDA7_9BIVA|nr:hypothetical protein CHS0354_021079 [Potamilus streckersoni]